MTQIDPSERAALDADDECYTPLYGAAIEWSNAREATKTAYQFFQNEATRTVARLMLDALIAIEDQKWAAVISATAALAVAPDPAPDDAEFEACGLCGGTGDRWDSIEGMSCGPCFACNGTGDQSATGGDGKGHDPAPGDAEILSAMHEAQERHPATMVIESVRTQTFPFTDQDAPDDAEIMVAVGEYADARSAFREGLLIEANSSARLERVESARQRILALHRQATHAGLRELRGRVNLVDVDAETPLNVSDTWKQGFQFGLGLALNVSTEQIDALLKEATDG